ncbi:MULTISPECIES: hypothetical protein [Massilia]|uniref:Uncharacterized protein n=1 Tax=Massilia haematophila TaxID=457923 RepID=A0ABV7PFB0_9BURK|nr:hypothetical protein [Massilia sp.]
MRRLPGIAAAVGRVAVCAGALAGAPALAQTLPSTFAPTIGSALLCRSALDNAYFHSYLTGAFGPAYKHEGGAYWFRLDATLWGKAVKEVMVSDDTSPLVFVAAVADSKPEELEEAIRASAGIRHRAVDASAFPLRVSNPGSVIAYQNNKSKIYCARYKPLPPGP